MDSEPDWLEYFSGGVPTGVLFGMTLNELRDVSALQKDSAPGINRLQELCFIGLISYFEAFCKDHFASLINLEPSLIFKLKASGQDVSVDATHVVTYSNEVGRRIGFVLAEKYDFGTAQKINALFNGLLKVTPFGRDDAKRYANLLRDRNLLVHHGGIFTMAYVEQHSSHLRLNSDAFYNSRCPTSQEVLDATTFIEEVAKKMLRSSQNALTQHLEASGNTCSGERKKAIEAISMWDD